MSDDLVKRVAREIYHHWPDCRRGASAAIALALEEAAKVCDERIALLHGQFDVLDVTRECDAYRIAAAAIRAMIQRSQP